MNNTNPIELQFNSIQVACSVIQMFFSNQTLFPQNQFISWSSLNAQPCEAQVW
jgi:hypothetical protein